MSTRVNQTTSHPKPKQPPVGINKRKSDNSQPIQRKRHNTGDIQITKEDYISDKFTDIPLYLHPAINSTCVWIKISLTRLQKAKDHINKLNLKDSDGNYTHDQLQITINPNITKNSDRHVDSLAAIKRAQGLILKELVEYHTNITIKINGEFKDTLMSKVTESINAKIEYLEQSNLPVDYQSTIKEKDALLIKVKQFLDDKIMEIDDILYSNRKVKYITLLNSAESRAEDEGATRESNHPSSTPCPQTSRESKGQGADATSKARPTPQTASGTRQICQAPSESGPKTTVPTILLRTATVSTSFASTSKILEREFDNKCIRPNFKILTCKPLSNKVITLLNKGYKYIPQTTHRDKQTLTSTQVASLGFAPDNTELMNSVALLDLLLTHMRKAVLRQIPYNYIQRLTLRLTCNH